MRLAWIAVLLVACGDNHAAAPDAAHGQPTDAPGAIDAPIDGTVTPDANPLEPPTLAGTGLCLDAACTQISPDVHAYAPQFTLFSDGATKRRWIELPAGTQIDSSDMDHWSLPVGTKLWKEFTDEHGVRIETRYLVKIADDTAAQPWFYVSYAWNAAQDAATAVPEGVQDANGTTHDIPSRGECKQCHENLLPTRALGFGAISLDYTPADPAFLDLDGLVAADLLTVNPPGAQSPHYPVPGTAAERAALGYLHANCGHCHNSTSSNVHNALTPIELRLDTAHLATVAETRTYETTVDVTGHTLPLSGSDCPDVTCAALTVLVKSGDSAHSILYQRMHAAGLLGTSNHMPALGAKTIDPVGESTIQTWIDSL